MSDKPPYIESKILGVVPEGDYRKLEARLDRAVEALRHVSLHSTKLSTRSKQLVRAVLAEEGRRRP